MEKQVKKVRIPKTDSIRELAEFFDTHDASEFEDDLKDVTEPVFVRKPIIRVELLPREVKAVEKLAKSQGLSTELLIQSWIREQLPRRRKPVPAAAK